LNIWIDGLSSFTGWFLEYEKPIYLVLEKNSDLPTAMEYLKRIGYDNVKGYLDGGITEWYSAGNVIDKMETMQSQDLKSILATDGEFYLLDVRTDDEWELNHIPGANHIYVGNLADKLNSIPKTKNIITYCTIGLRSTVAASYLLKEGFTNTSVLLGGIESWEKNGLELV
jgi:hydroxyacylglutathione hydrolase